MNDIRLGIYKTTAGQKFDCIFIPSKNLARAVEMPENIGFGSIKTETKAGSADEAKKKLAMVLGSGSF
jgi:hypothetical protein